jgi:hypothetical protein
MTPGGRIPIDWALNHRDRGRWTTTDGRQMRRGLLYRSTELDKLEKADLDAFAKLGIRSVETCAPRRSATPIVSTQSALGGAFLDEATT